jgi:hypothetical protein
METARTKVNKSEQINLMVLSKPIPIRWRQHSNCVICCALKKHFLRTLQDIAKDFAALSATTAFVTQSFQPEVVDKEKIVPEQKLEATQLHIGCMVQCFHCTQAHLAIHGKGREVEECCVCSDSHQDQRTNFELIPGQNEMSTRNQELTHFPRNQES